MKTKLTSKEIEQLYEALPTKELYKAINDAETQLQKIYGDFVIQNLGYKTVDEAMAHGWEYIYDQQDGIKDLVHALPDYQKLSEVIIQNCYE
jgi:hypothetical protein